jgi:hypothetical protein
VYLNRAKTEVESAARERFIRAYQLFIPEVRHVLYVVNKGFAQEELCAQYALFQALEPRFINVDDESFDLEAYRKAARQIEEPIVFFMNTPPEPLQQGWLDKVYACFTTSDNIGLAGCTGNVETHHPFAPDFPAYPNYHVRSNAFMLARHDYLKMLEGRKLENKLQAYQIEAGRLSLTQMIQATGRKAVVVGKQGEVQQQNLWRAGIFRSGCQQNLLLADNQTRHYQQASKSKKLVIWLINYSYLSQIYPYQRLCFYLIIYPLSRLRKLWLAIKSKRQDN